jgi:C-terminal processing protease CtpA/Prc
MTQRSAAFTATVLGALVLLGSGAPVRAADPGWFGLAVSADVEEHSPGPTLRSLSVRETAPGSPAARAGLAAGDVILEIQGVEVAGMTTDALKAAMQRSVGETLHLKIRHGATDTREVAMTAAPRPPDP